MKLELEGYVFGTFPGLIRQTVGDAVDTDCTWKRPDKAHKNQIKSTPTGQLGQDRAILT